MNNFWDEAIIELKAGKGGDGIVSFHHEKYMPKGGPDGGDGGHGGDIYFVATTGENTLVDFVRLKKIKAEDGSRGSKNNKTGKDGGDLILKVPVGTVVYQDLKLVFDLDHDGQKILIAEGGKGGYGNAHYVSSVRQVPTYAQPGKPGENKTLRLELKLIAQVGLMGKPNVGKSTILSVISKARPKIANYEFTTIVPNLGVAQYAGEIFVVADIPGLIEGASAGKGLGQKFLRHIERVKVLVHVLDATSLDLEKDYQIIRDELKQYSEILLEKPEIIVINKIDVVDENELKEKIKKLSFGVMQLSAVTQKGIKELLQAIVEKLAIS